MSDKTPDLPHEPEAYFREPQVGSMQESVPFNANGDRLLLPGSPEGIEKWVQHRQRQATLQAEEYIRGHLDQAIPELVQVATQDQLDSLIHLIRSLCIQTSKAFLDSYQLTVKKAIDHMPPHLSIPDPRDKGPNLVDLVGTHPPHNPMIQEATSEEKDPC